MDSKENLALMLKKWAVEEMRFHSSSYNNGKSIPTERDFEKLCRTPLSNIWEFLLRQTKSAQYARQVKENLALQRVNRKRKDRQPDETKDGHGFLQKRRHELEAERLYLADDMTVFERETAQVSELLEDAKHTYEKDVEHVRNLQRKQSLLCSACQCGTEKVAELSEYGSRLDALVDSVRIKRKETDRNNYHNSGNQQLQTDMETESCRDVRLVCENISACLHPSLVNQQTEEDTKKSVLDKVSDLHSSYNIHTLVDSLTTHTVSCTKLLREETVKVNIPSEVQDLSFSMDKRGHVCDEAKPHSMQKCVQKLLQASHLKHVMRWSEEQKYLCESWKVEAQLDNMRGEIHKLVVKAMGGNSDLVRQAEAYVDMLLHLASEKAVVPCLKQEIQILTNKITNGKAVHEDLRAKFSQIQEFKKIVENKQNILGSLARHNSSAPTRLDKLKEECNSYLASRPVHSHLDLVDNIACVLMGSLDKEIVKFHPLPLICFLSLHLNSGVRSSALDMSIFPSIVQGTRGSVQSFSMLCQALHCPEYKSPDQLLSHVLHLQDCIQQSHLAQEKMDSDRTTMCRKAGVQDDPQCHRDLTQRSLEHDVQLQESSLPRLKHLDEMACRWSRKITEDISADVEAWWDQPAQHTTPWVVVEGLTFDQWVQRFRVIISQVHQKHTDKQM